MPSSPDPRTTTATGADVRVRFCPSPTGLPHVGLIRTVLFNWAYARNQGGKLIFRIEDTDAARDSEESYLQLLEALRWLKIDWDEGVEVGGPHAPYRQSERHDIYREVLAKLVEAGAVYESYSTADEIDARNEANGRAKQLGYDNYDRDLTDEQRAAFRAEGREPAWRLRVPDEDLTYVDLIRGEVTFPAGSFPDFVLVRAGGVPLYPFVNPVDDALMGITHVIRGEDLMPSTARQLALYRALVDAGVTTFIPRFAHMPLVLGEEGNKKLSKRDPKADLFLQREKGFIHEGLLNYLALLGWSIGPDRDVFSLDELVAAFDIADVNPNPARFDQKKAESINGDHIRMLEAADFAARLVPYLAAAGVVSDPPTPAQLATLAAAAPLVQERMQLLGDAPGLLGFLFTDTVTYQDDALASLPANAGEVLVASVSALELVPESEFTTAAVQEALASALVSPVEDGGLGLKPRIAYGPLRVALSGRRVSPPLFESMELLGKPETIRRLGLLVDARG
ncbi:glutamate--tRNA ligase [Microbacterium sp. CFH 90308]|uniref:Glutamate--tRNA ligase n=1 Tax=Microbacterium salsuginis TaxID=2722803 RepID=A0ABX1KF75_9MICO|nr:glutamate--tRNA ligase [Microbacterium sp. CFH 90308]NLP85706.1 glutamate--tRNA ligase [Microbacterium sp. CFH 90308]